PCEGGMQCTTADAPLDWSDPGRDTIELALIRKVSTGDSLGSLLINPGGPGASGFEFVRDSLDYAVSARLKQSYDIVGFDPRAVHRSSAVDCYHDPAELTAFLYAISPGAVGSEPWTADIEQWPAGLR